MAPTLRQILGIISFCVVIPGILLYGLGSLPYLETSEARYAEIAREMAISGDWITPHLTFIKHFDKPPLTYMVTAAAFKLMGVNDFSGRLPLVAVAMIILWYTRCLARLLFPAERSTPDISLFILLSSILFLSMARTLTTDFYLALFTVGSVYHLLRWFLQERRTIDAFLSGLFLGLGLLTKGHVILVFTLLPWLPVAIINRSKRPLKPFDLLLFTVFPLFIFLPWLIYVLYENPQLINFFINEQTIGRVATNVNHRSQPIYFYLEVLCLGMLFWFTYFLAFLPRAIRRPTCRIETLLLFFSLIPLAFFSLTMSKLIPYLLPALPFYAVLIGHWLSEGTPRPGLHIVDFINLTLAGSLVAAELVLSQLKHSLFGLSLEIAPAIAGASLLVLLGMLLVWKKQPVFSRMGFGILTILLFLGGVGAAPYIQEHINGFKTVAAAIMHDRQDSRPYRIISYNGRLPSITFYTGKRIIQIPHDRKLRFEDEDSRLTLDDYVSKDIQRIPQLLAEPIPTYLIIKKDDWRELPAKLPTVMTLVREVYATPRYLTLANRQ